MRPFPRTIREVSTPKRRSSPIKLSAIGLFGGRTVTYRDGRPNCATATATLASPPPKVATNCGDWRKRSKPGGARRSMGSPKVTMRDILNSYHVRGSTYKTVVGRDTVLLDGVRSTSYVEKKNRTGMRAEDPRGLC